MVAAKANKYLSKKKIDKPHELFGKILGWNIGMEYNIVALQAVMADMLGGDTIHHALNIGIFGKKWKSNQGNQETRARETMKSMLMLRWLIIDEISMVGRAMRGKIALGAQEYLGAKPRAFGGEAVSTGGLDLIETGFFKQPHKTPKVLT